VAGIGIAGVPEAGLISLSLVLATVGLPLEILPLLLTVDWLLSRARAMTNVTSDMVVAVLLDALGRRRNLATAGAARTTAGSATSP
jgi:DAACS family dicarboxylate/amino acid:cation (Na+ or H+) symporter